MYLAIRQTCKTREVCCFWSMLLKCNEHEANFLWAKIYSRCVMQMIELIKSIVRVLWGFCLHNNVMTWKCCLHYCPFVIGNHWKPSYHCKKWSFYIFSVIMVSLNMLPSKQHICWWNEISKSSWDVIQMMFLNKTYMVSWNKRPVCFSSNSYWLVWWNNGIQSTQPTKFISQQCQYLLHCMNINKYLAWEECFIYHKVSNISHTLVGNLILITHM